MNTTKYVLFGALGVAALLLLTSDKAKELRNDLDDRAKKLTDKLMKAGNNTATTLAELRELLNNEIEGLSDDARQRIENILNGTSKNMSKMKRQVSDQFS